MKKNKRERIRMVKAMEFIARQINDEEVFEDWLMNGVADGDIEYGDLDVRQEDFERFDYYIKNDVFADLEHTFLRVMKSACHSGGLCCDGVIDKECE